VVVSGRPPPGAASRDDCAVHSEPPMAPDAGEQGLEALKREVVRDLRGNPGSTWSGPTRGQAIRGPRWPGGDPRVPWVVRRGYASDHPAQRPTAAAQLSHRPRERASRSSKPGFRDGRHASAPSGRVPTTATAGESGRKPAPGTERLWIVLSVAERTLPPGRPSGYARPARGRRAANAARHAIGAASMSVPAGGAMVVLNQQPAPRGARRDDYVNLPSTWVVARIAGGTG
jgi:hypothetical protein